MRAAQSVHFDEHLDNAVSAGSNVKQRDRLGTEAAKVARDSLADSEEATTAGVISKDEFKRL